MKWGGTRGGKCTGTQNLILLVFPAWLKYAAQHCVQWTMGRLAKIMDRWICPPQLTHNRYNNSPVVGEFCFYARYCPRMFIVLLPDVA